MITRVQLLNFESHKDTILDFPTGLTVFIGETDRGKSGAFRGINWVRTNSPLGDWMIPKFWDGDTIVTITTSDNKEISRIKNGTTNNYFLSSKNVNWNGNAGTDVPEQIKDALDMEEDFHFQSQIDRSYLMFDTPGERGRTLNKICGLDKINTTTSNAGTDVKRINNEIKSIKKDIKQTKEELEIYQTLPEIEDKLIQLEELEKLIQYKDSTINKVIRLAPILWENLELEKKGVLLKKVQSRMKRLGHFEERIKNLSTSIKKSISLKTERNFLIDKVNKKYLLNQSKLILEELEELVKNKQFLENKYNTVRSLYFKQTTLKKQYKDLEKQINKIKSLLPNICPTCGELLKNEKKTN